jgi:hypothetical protein
VPNSNQSPFLDAACWAWALAGEYENVENAYTVPTVYSSDNGAFVFNARRDPIGLNEVFFDTTDEIFPQTIVYHSVLIDDFATALRGDAAAQDRCRVALMKMTATLNGHSVLADTGPDVYTIMMRSSSWYGWDHWSIGIKQVGAGQNITYQQKVSNTPLSYGCRVTWDEGLLLRAVIRIDGLLDKQITMLNNVS